MNKIDNMNNLDVLKRILRSPKIDPINFIIIVTGRSGPTGKTWLCQELLKCGYRAMELTPGIHSISINDDGVNHMVVDEDNKQVVVVLNEILPMYWGKTLRSDFNDEDIYTFDSLSDAQKALFHMRCVADKYGAASRADFKDLVDKETDFNDIKYGWTLSMLREARVVRHRYGYFIEFPKSYLIKELTYDNRAN